MYGAVIVILLPSKNCLPFYTTGEILTGAIPISIIASMAALLYPNRVRMVGISSIMEKLHQAYLERNQLQEMRLRNNLWLLGIMFIILIIALVFIVVQFRKTKNPKQHWPMPTGS